MRLLKSILFILFLFSLFNCSKRNCPLPVEYSPEFQKKLLEDVNKANSPYINKIMIDFYNINNNL